MCVLSIPIYNPILLESPGTFLLPFQETIFSMVHSRHLVEKTKIVIRFIGSEVGVLEGKSVQNNSNELSL